MNAPNVNEIVFGASSTQLTLNLSNALEPLLTEGDEIILSTTDHETNTGCWVKLAERLKLKILWWHPRLPEDKSSLAVTMDVRDLKPLLSSKTRFVAFTATSNILGNQTDVRSAVDLIKSTSSQALVCVDCVAYAPHNSVDVQAMGADFVFFSVYKVYGPHISVLWAKSDVQKQLKSLAHFCKLLDAGRPVSSLPALPVIPNVGPYALQPGGPN